MYNLDNWDDSDQLKEIFNLYDEELDGKIDGTQIGDVVRAAGLKPTNAMVTKASGQEYKRKGEKRITFEEWLPIFEQLSKEKASFQFTSLFFSFFSIHSFLLYQHPHFFCSSVKSWRS
ncbi:unnamed protein product [Strongylus vulgaris]|uniref:EF-hand domain-containing protein n=1 Tax=Strongylus vulgaris TaxID=40348 RepID=A0A3P7IX62_STRVU|nr:unnamed protein product [Strongylus vulgaris]